MGERPWRLHAAAHRGDTRRVRRLLASGECSPGLRDPDGLTPLHLAALMGHAELCDVLLQHGDTHVDARDWQVEPLSTCPGVLG
jgi:ankyrin repeat protein